MTNNETANRERENLPAFAAAGATIPSPNLNHPPHLQPLLLRSLSLLALHLGLAAYHAPNIRDAFIASHCEIFQYWRFHLSLSNDTGVRLTLIPNVSLH